MWSKKASRSGPVVVQFLFDKREPHAASGPFVRWPRLADGILALTVFAVSLITVAASAIGDGEDFKLALVLDHPPGIFVLLALTAASLLWRRSEPLVTSAVVVMLMIIWATAGFGDGQDLGLVVAIYSVGRHAADHRLSLIAMALFIVVSILSSIIDDNQRIDIGPAVALTALPWYLGHRIRNRGDYLALLQERAERLLADQRSAERRAVANERSRIARELHDVVAHQVSMMTIQAGAAKTVANSDVAAAINAMGDVERAGRQALGELRHLLGVLRTDDPDSESLGPQPRLENTLDLAEHLRGTGADVTLNITDLPASLPAAIELSGYRIIQESVTNIIKHAGPNPTVNIDVAITDNTLVIGITNTVSSLIPAMPASGYGLAGMSERAALLGGTLTAATQSPSRYHVEARLPIEPESR